VGQLDCSTAEDPVENLRPGQARRPGPALRHRPQPEDQRTRRALDRDRRGPHHHAAGAAVDGEREALGILTERREALTRRRVQTVDRLQPFLAELLPGQAKRDITTGQAKTMLATVRPRDTAGKTRRRIAAEELNELIAVEAKIKKATAELKAVVLAARMSAWGASTHSGFSWRRQDFVGASSRVCGFGTST
jgi:hypothetical protein